MRTTSRRVLVGAAVTLAVTAATTVVWSRVTTPSVVLSVDGDTVGVGYAFVGSVYNLGVRIENNSDDDVRIESAKFADLPPGLNAQEPLLGLCSEHGMPAVDVGADLARNRGPSVTLAPLHSRVVQPLSAQPKCSYILLRVVPTVLGTHVAKDVTVRYRSGWRKITARVKVSFELPTTGTGHDPRDKVALLDDVDAGAEPSPAGSSVAPRTAVGPTRAETWTRQRTS